MMACVMMAYAVMAFIVMACMQMVYAVLALHSFGRQVGEQCTRPIAGLPPRCPLTAAVVLAVPWAITI